MTDITTGDISAQSPGAAMAGPPLADTTDMAQVHQVFRDAFASVPQLIGSATARGPARIELVAAYYATILDLLHAHHEGEDVVIWPKLIERAPDWADEVRRVANQHGEIMTKLDEATVAVQAWASTASESNAGAAATALAELGAQLLPHLDEEESFIVPLAAQYIYAPEWGELPGHAMRSYQGDKLWLILGLIREQMRPEQIAMVEAHMPPPVREMWNEHGATAFSAFVSELRTTS